MVNLGDVISAKGVGDFTAEALVVRKNPKNDEVRNIGINEIKYLQLLILAKIDFFSRPLRAQRKEFLINITPNSANSVPLW